MYVNIYDIEKHHQDNKNRKLNVQGADERELEEALQKSLKEYNEANPDEGGSGVGTVLNRGAGGA